MTRPKIPSWVWQEPWPGRCGRPTGKKSRPFCTIPTIDGAPCLKHRNSRERYLDKKARREVYDAQLARVISLGMPACHEWEPLARPYPEPSGSLTRVEHVLSIWQECRCAICGIIYEIWEL